MANFVIRSAKREDRGEVQKLWWALMDMHQALDERFRLAEDAVERWQNSYSDWLYEDDHKLWIAVVEQNVVGYIAAHYAVTSSLFEPPGEVFIQELYVLPEYRGKGIGKALVDRVKDWAIAFGSRRIGLIASTQNAAALTFWKQQNATEFAVQAVIEL
ncbi:MAG: GNAT family N-acetyltransferase [Rhodothermia bacterium]|nr:GNAT family N-acetyltransferase [Rhodothermia bacterium]